MESKASKLIKVIESITDQSKELRINEDRVKIVFVDADENSLNKVMDVLNQTFPEKSVTVPSQDDVPQCSCGSSCSSDPTAPMSLGKRVQPCPRSSNTPNPIDRSEFVSGNAVRISHFFDICRCRSCGYESHRNIMGVPCGNISCPKCGAPMCEFDTERRTTGWTPAAKPSVSDF